MLHSVPTAAWNYEVGEKAKLLDNRLTINGDVYYIRWQGVQQVITLPCGYQYYNNAGDGRAFGPELEINAKLPTSWTRAVERLVRRFEDHLAERLLQQLLSAWRIPRMPVAIRRIQRSRPPMPGHRQLHGADPERGQGQCQRLADL